MSDKFQGQTMTEAFRFISGGSALTFTFGFQPDKVVFNNLTDWTATAGNLPESVWFRDQTDAAAAYQKQVIDTNAGQSFNYLDTTTNGFTVADTSGGVTDVQRSISGITAANPGVVTTSAVHGYLTDQIVRITDLGSDMPTARGMGQLNNRRYRITVINTTTFSMRDVVTDEAINTTAFTAYVTGGSVGLETKVLTLNNPQVSPYDVTPYTPNAFAYDSILYKLTAGTSVIGTDGDIFQVEVIKWGTFTQLGDLG